ncbi:MAG: NADH-quinone oxidoreductase subunit NuoE [Thermococcus sp.]|uniref:NADH dehydrogenase subunit E n=1 Tax=Thermococcus guaymasensis DSM 11113 TaxID=1432656 RepID=A0A0X1KJ60_9EURY|nr:NADH-quinone oxidoreductase subunit NuoE [Thermococcus guaymasensis]AJC71288.1 NADH dehydrogenase subunit E [Thermococcus guaymasensis DSM 11113]MCD6372770.1 NADH-quinone oxidoreductase subunit NuoE [Thermococcus sp.]
MGTELDYLSEYPPEPSSLIPLLQRTQERFGYLPREVLEEIAKYVGVPLSRVYGVATFYAQFRFEPLGKYVIKVCHGTACHVNGAVNISQALTEELGIEEGQTTEDGLVTLERVACLGCCSLAPVIMINDKVFGKLTPDKVRKLIRKLKEGKLDV